MEDVLGIILEHRGVVGVAIVAVALYLANRLDMLPTFGRTRVRIEWADVQAEREKEHAQRAADLKQAAKWAEIKEAQERRLFTVIKGRSGGNEAA